MHDEHTHTYTWLPFVRFVCKVETVFMIQPNGFNVIVSYKKLLSLINYDYSIFAFHISGYTHLSLALCIVTCEKLKRLKNSDGKTGRRKNNKNNIPTTTTTRRK